MKPELLKRRYLPSGQERNPAVEDDSCRRISGTEEPYESGEKESLKDITPFTLIDRGRRGEKDRRVSFIF